MDTLIIVILGAVAIVALVILARRREPETVNSGVSPTTHPVGGFDEDWIAAFNRYPGTFAWNVVGESNYQSALEEICGGRTEDGHSKEVWAIVVPENGNPYDANAMAVHLDTGLVGYLSRTHASRVRLVTQNCGLAGYAIKVPAKVVGGWERPGSSGHFGVKLDLPGEPF